MNPSMLRLMIGNVGIENRLVAPASANRCWPSQVVKRPGPTRMQVSLQE
jgi:hypothetical protein